MNQLEQLKAVTVVVADTSDFESMRAYAPRDATTNPSLILRSARQPLYRPLLEAVLENHSDAPLHGRVDRLLVAFGLEILKIVPGRVSTEVDARLSFDVPATVAKAHELVALYEQAGISPERVLIKIAATWEGIRAAEILEREGIHCNLTLLFSSVQALACADAGATLISPFVGRITDWYKKNTGQDYGPEDDPGVQSVRQIYALFKNLDYHTQIMGASFRSVGQIAALAGCDLLTISPALLAELSASEAPLIARLTPEWARTQASEPSVMDEPGFRFRLNENAMASEKLAEGVRIFSADTRALEDLISKGA